MRDLIVWLNETGPSVALRESFFVWPILEASHVLTIMLFVGTILLVDLRLLGRWLPEVPVPEVNRRVLPWTVAGFVLLALTGTLLFYAKPLLYYHSVFFRLKMAIILVALVNILIFHKRVESDRDAWSGDVVPTAAKASAGFSLAFWIGVVIAGRMIAYDWYECPKLEPGGVLSTLAGCPSEGGDR